MASIPSEDGTVYACVRHDGSVVVKDDQGTGTIPCGAQATMVKLATVGSGGGSADTGYEVVIKQVHYDFDDTVPDPTNDANRLTFVEEDVLCPAGKHSTGAEGFPLDARSGDTPRHVIGETGAVFLLDGGTGWHFTQMLGHGEGVDHDVTYKITCVNA